MFELYFGSLDSRWSIESFFWVLEIKGGFVNFKEYICVFFFFIRYV